MAGHSPEITKLTLSTECWCTDFIVHEVLVEWYGFLQWSIFAIFCFKGEDHYLVFHAKLAGWLKETNLGPCNDPELRNYDQSPLCYPNKNSKWVTKYYKTFQSTWYIYIKKTRIYIYTYIYINKWICKRMNCCTAACRSSTIRNEQA